VLAIAAPALLALVGVLGMWVRARRRSPDRWGSWPEAQTAI